MCTKITTMSPRTAIARRIVWFILICCLILPFSVTALERFSITPSSTDSNDGSVNLSWTMPGQASIELQQSTLDKPTYEMIYRGTDTATVITGLPDGNYLYRARLKLENGDFTEWTEPVSVNVMHHSLTRAFLFFSIGALVFLATLLLILFGARAPAIQGDAH